MRRLTTLTVILVAILLPPPAIAATINVLTTGSVGGTNVPVGDLISGGLKPGTQASFTTMPGGSTGVFCSRLDFSATVNTNPPAGGVAVLSLTTLTFGACTSNLPGLSLRTITVGGLPYTVTFDGSTKVVSVTGGGGPIQVTIGFNSVFGPLSCGYRTVNGTITGLMSNADSSITFGQQFIRVSGSSLCPANLYFSATFIVTAGGARVFIQ